MAEYIDRNLIEWYGCDFEDDLCKDCSDCSHAECSHSQIMQIPVADVVEREKIDKAIEEIEQTLYVDSLIFGELIDFKDGKISADDVIEEFNRVTRKEVLEILKRNIGESKNEITN